MKQKPLIYSCRECCDDFSYAKSDKIYFKFSNERNWIYIKPEMVDFPSVVVEYVKCPDHST